MDARGARVLVTGAQGFLGRYVCARLLELGAESVVGVGRSPALGEVFTHLVSGEDGPVQMRLTTDLAAAVRDPRYDYVRCDAADEEALYAVLAERGADVVIHSAAALRDASWDALVTANLHVTHAVMGASERAGVRRVVNISSGSVYGAAGGRLPITEEAPLLPVDPYGVTKKAAEDLVRVLGARSGLETTTGRVFNIMGPGLQPQHLPGLLARRLTEPGPDPVQLRLGTLTATRDFVDVRDAADAVARLALARTPPAVVNVASGVEVQMRELVDAFVQASGRDVRLEVGEGRAGDIDRSVADVSRLTALGHLRRYPLERTVADMLAAGGDTLPARA